MDGRVRGFYDTISDDDEREEAQAPFHARQDDLLPLIVEARARTPEGVMARARMLALCDPDLIARGQTGWNDMMMSALLGDMLALAA